MMMSNMEFSANENLFPLPFPSDANAPRLEAEMIQAMRRNAGKLVSVYAVARRDGEEIVLPVTWRAPTAVDTAYGMAERKVDALAIACTREGALLVGFR